jgi:hypothetical protein
VQDHGAHPELLTFVRKPRGTEAHKGGTLYAPGDPPDVCITSWLAGKTDTNACDSSSPDITDQPAAQDGGQDGGP